MQILNVVEVIMRALHFGHRALIVTGCLGLLIAMVHAQPGPPGTGGLTQENAVCKKQACTKTAGIVGHQACPYNGGDVRGTCMFDKSMGDLVWCDTSTEKCTIGDPIMKSWCTGYCENMPSLACDTALYSKCTMP